MSLIARAVAYYRDPRSDLKPALKILWQSQKPLRAIASYFTALAFNKVPVLAQRADRQPVDFTRYMRAYDNTTASFHPYREAMGKIVELMDLKGGEQVVDLGSGTGNLSLALERQGAKVTSLDYCSESLALHKEKNPAATVVQADLKSGRLPFDDQSADRICAANVWTYLTDPEKRASLYADIQRVIRPGGYFVLGVERTGYSPAKILKYHLGKEYRRYLTAGDLPLTALARTYANFISHYEDLLITASESLKLVRKMAAGEYVLFTDALIKAEFEAAGFRIISQSSTYADQVIVIKAALR